MKLPNRRRPERRPATLELLEARIAPATFFVRNVNDSGPDSLRDAIIQANASPNAGSPDLIAFNIAGAAPHTIQLLPASGALPAITDPVIINGYTQPDAVPNSLAADNPKTNAVLTIVLDGSQLTTGNGLTLATSGSTIEGLVIGGFKGPGIVIQGSAASGNSVLGNFIGTDASGATAKPNAGPGIIIFQGGNNLIGDGTSLGHNVISGNAGGGVLIDSALSGQGSGNKLFGNSIGLAANGGSALANAGNGVSIRDSQNQQIGGASAGQGNFISFNSGDGVAVGINSGQPESLSVGNLIRGNAITSNGGLGINLGRDGVTANDTGDADTGANARQNFPIIQSVDAQATTLIISGVLQSAPGSTFDLEFFISSAADSSGFGEGAKPIGTTTVTTSGTGDTTFLFSAGGDFRGQIFTATATDRAANNTSEFSLAFSPLLVTTAADVLDGSDGLISLREAINFANSNANAGAPDTIRFNIAGSGVHKIAPSAALGVLPQITDAVVIDGYSQPGASKNSLPVGDNAVLLIELSGENILGSSKNGLLITAGGSTVGGLVINRFPSYGIVLRTGGGNTIAGNFLGSNSDGLTAPANQQFGLLIDDSAGNLIGGTTTDARNLISGNNGNGVEIIASTAGSSTNNVIRGNYIGTTRDGTAPLGNGFLSGGNGIYTAGGNTQIVGNVIAASFEGIVINLATAAGTTVQGNFIGTDVTGTLNFGNADFGIEVAGTPNVLIGGSAPGAGNVISGNGSGGVSIEGATSTGAVVQGNFIGTNATGTAGIPNEMFGVLVFGASGARIGGVNAGEANVIAFNHGDGVRVETGGATATGNAIRGNAIHDNAKLGINLVAGGDLATGVTPNDTGDSDTGANGLQNFPVLSSATRSASAGSNVSGALHSAAGATFTIDFYASSAADASGFGEGEFFLGNISVTTNGSGDAVFNFNPGGTSPLPPGSFITAVAADGSGNSSEFSGALAVQTVFVWDGSGGADTSWFNPLNWDLDSGVPAAGDTAILNINSTINLPSDASVGIFQQSNGTFTSPAGVTFTVLNAFNWTGGTQAGLGTTSLPAAATLNMSGTAQKTLEQRTLANAGTITWTGTGNFTGRDSSIINNSGLFDIQTDADVTSFNVAAIFNNLAGGTLRKSAGAALTQTDLVLNNSGLIDVQTGTVRNITGGSTGGTYNVASGAVLDFGAGAYTAASAATIQGGGTMQLTTPGAVNLANGSGVTGTGTTLALAGATLSLAGTTTVASGAVFAQSSGTLSGAGTLAMNGTLNWSGGTQDTLGATTSIAAGGALNLSGAAQKTLQQRTLANAGTVTWTGTGNFTGRDSSIINNSGLFDIQTDGDITRFNVGATFNNLAGGTLRKSAGIADTTTDMTFNNAGTFDVQAGSVSFNNFTQTGGATILSGGSIGGGVTLAFQGGELRGAGTITGNVNNTGATVRPGGTGAAGTLTLTGTYTQGAGGTLAAELGGTGAGTQYDVLSVGGTATLGGTLNVTYLGGFAPVFGNTFDVVTATTRAGTFGNVTGATQLTPTYTATAAQLVRNAVTFTWDAGGGGDTSWFTPLNWDANFGFPGAGDTAILSINSTINLPSNTGVGTFQQSTGTFTSAAGVTFTVLNNFAWSGGTESGAGTTQIAAGATLNLTNVGAVTIDARTLAIKNGATAQWSGGGSIQFSNSGAISNAGTFLAQNSVSLTRTDGSAPAFNNLAGGVFTKTGTGTTTSTSGVAFNNAGTVNVNTVSALIDFANLTLSDGAAFNGPGVSRASGSFSIAGTTTITNGAALELLGGTLAGTGTFGGTGNFNFASGTSSAALTIASGSTALFSGINAKNLSGGSLTVPSGATVDWSGGSIQLLNDAAINNSGTFLAQTSNSITKSDGSNPLFNNQAGGIFSKTGTGTTTVAGTFVFNNAGTVNVATAGALISFGNLSPSNGASFTGAGVSRVTGALAISGTTTIGAGATLELNGGTVSGTGTIGGAGNFDVATGSLTGALTIASGGTIVFSGINGKTLSGGTLTIASGGTAQWSGTGAIQLSNSATINNSGSFLAQNNASLARIDGSAPAFNNLAGGTLAKTTTSGTTTISGVTFGNAGTIDAQIGTLNFANGYTQTAGATQLSGGNITAGAALALSGGVLTGVGTISGSVNNTGATVRPGGTGTAGTLTISGNYTQGAGGTLEVELAGTSSFDVLAAGTATLNGTLNIANLGGFTPAGGNTFRVVTSSNNPTTFDSLAGATTGITQSADATGLLLTATAIVFVWDNSVGDGDWFKPNNWNLDSGVPGAGDVAVLGINSQINLNASTSVGTFQQSNGTFTSGAGVTFTVLQNFAWSAGTQSGAGTTSIASGGTMAISGAATKTLDARTLSIANGATASWSGSGQLQLANSAKIDNSGVFDLQSDAVLSGGTFNNQGGATLRKSGGTGVSSFGAAVSLLAPVEVQTGTLRFTGGGSGNLASFTRGASALAATVEFGGGTFSFTNNTTFTGGILGLVSAGVFNVPGNPIIDTGAELRVTGGTATVSGITTVSSTGILSVQGGSLALNNFATIVAGATLSLGGGTLAGTGTMDVDGVVNWTGGALGGSGSTIIHSGAALNLSGGLKTLTQRALTISAGGTATWTAGQFEVLAGATINNSGLFNSQTDAPMTSDSGADEHFNNQPGGIFRKSAGAGVQQIGNTGRLSFANGGSVQVQSGTLEISSAFDNTGAASATNGRLLLDAGGTSAGSFDALAAGAIEFGGGTHVLNAGTTWTGVGVHRISAGTVTLNTAVSTTNFELLGGALGGSATLTITASASWQGGAMNGGGVTTLNAGVPLTIGSNAVKTLSQRTLNLGGATTWTGGGMLEMLNGATLNNSGVLDSQTDAPMTSDGTATAFNNLAGATFKKTAGTSQQISNTQNIAFTNAGTVLVQSGTLDVHGAFNNTGASSVTTGTLLFSGGGTSTGGFAAATGAVIEFSGGTHTLNAGATWTGVGVHRISGGTVTLNTNVSTVAFEQLGGTLGGAGTLTVTGSMNWQGGTMSGGGTTTLNAGVPLTISTNGTKTLSQRTLNLGGATTWTGGGRIEMLNGAIINNSGVFDSQTDAPMTSDATVTAFNNQTGATFKKSAGTLQQISNTGNLAFNNNGTVQVQAGVLQLSGGGAGTNGTLDLAASAILELSGSAHTLNGATTFTGGGKLIVTSNVIVASGGSFALGGGILDGAGTFDVRGTLNWTGGKMAGAGATSIAASGTLAMSGSADKRLIMRTLSNSGTVTWTGTGQFAIDGAPVNNSGVFDLQSDAVVAVTGGAPVFNNLAGGTLEKTGGSGTSTISLGIAVNNAGAIVAQSGTLDLGSAFTQTAGSTTLAGGALTSPGTLVFSGGTLAGVGSIGGSVNNSGATVQPGNGGAGTLSIANNYTQGAGGTLVIELAGTGAGQFDVLNVSGSATLAGTLNVTELAPFVVAAPASFAVLPYSSHTGMFAAVNEPAALTPNYQASGLVLTAAASVPLVVTTALDVVDPADGVVSLREAILFANSNAGLDTITFNIPGNFVHTIAPSSSLPFITDAVVIDGYSQPGASANTLANGNNAVLLIELDGEQTFGASGLEITGGGSTVRGLVINRFSTGDGIALDLGGGNVIEGNFIGTNAAGTAALPNGGQGIDIFDGSNLNVIGGTSAASRNVIAGNFYGIAMSGGVTGTRIEGNFIGTNAAGTAALGNFGAGVLIDDSPSNTIGGATAGAGNVISGNDGDGVSISGANATGNVVQGNRIGTDVSGTLNLGNTVGVLLSNGAANNTIGGTTAGARNVISGNDVEGVNIQGTATTGNVVLGNFIGTDVTGTVAIPISGSGVTIFDAPGNTIGGTVAGSGNVISGNDVGVGVRGDGATGNVVQGNFIGTDVTGTQAVPNATVGVLLDAPGVTIGGETTGAGNVISGNGGSGIQTFIVFSTGVAGTVIAGNFIGTDKTGTLPLANAGDGVAITQADFVTIGGLGASERNIIAFNSRSGVNVGEPVRGVVLLGNSIFSNGVLGIDLNDDGIANPNDADDSDSGANDLLNTPVITSAKPNSTGGADVTGTVTTAVNGTVRIEFFLAAGGQGKTFLGFTDVVSAAGVPVSFSASLGSGSAGDQIVATTSDLSVGGAGTSEFSAAATVIPPALISISDAAIVEGASGKTTQITFTITLDKQVPATVTVNFDTAAFSADARSATAGVDYTAVSGGLVTFGPNELTKTIVIDIKGDDASEPVERFNVVLSNATNAGIGDGTGAGAIIDDDHHTFAVSEGSGNRFSAFTATATGATLVQTIEAFTAGYKGGVRVAVGDVNGDGTDDIIAGAGLGGRAKVRVFDGLTFQPLPGVLGDLSAFGTSYRGGVFVAAGDVNGDGFADVIVTPSAGSLNQVRIFSGADGLLLKSFRAFGAGAGGVRVAAGDVNGDGFADVIAGTGVGSSVRTFDALGGTVLSSVRVFSKSYRGGVYVAAGDVNVDGIADLIVSAAAGAPHVRTYLQGLGGVAPTTFDTYGGGALHGARVSVLDVNSDGVADIIAAQGRRGVSKVSVFDGSDYESLFGLQPFATQLDGLYVG